MKHENTRDNRKMFGTKRVVLVHFFGFGTFFLFRIIVCKTNLFFCAKQTELFDGKARQYTA